MAATGQTKRYRNRTFPETPSRTNSTALQFEGMRGGRAAGMNRRRGYPEKGQRLLDIRSEEHTSELQSQSNLVCRLLLEKKKKNQVVKHIRQKRMCPEHCHLTVR